MSTVLQVGNLVQLRIWTSVPASFQAAVNSCWYVVSAVGGSPALDVDFANQMDGVIGPVYKPLLTNLGFYNGVQAIVHSPIAPYPAIAVPSEGIGNAGAGTGGAVPLPKQSAGILRFLTDRPGPSGRGRIYLAFPPQALDSGGGSCSATYITRALALGAEIGVGVAVSAGGRTAVLVRALVHGKNKLGVFPAPSPVQDFKVDEFWATQKRRGSFGRQNFSPV